MPMPPEYEWKDARYGAHKGAVLWQKGADTLIECACCGFRHIVPLPSETVQKAFYEESFYQSEKAKYLAEAEEDFAWKAVECGLRIDIAVELSGIKAGRVLDIGSGPGDFLKVAQSRGWDAVGIEPSPVAARYAASRGLNVINGFFNADTAKDLGRFDFIHLSEVLEHIAEPESLLKLARSLLKKNGVLCVSVPNDFNPLQGVSVKKLEKEKWWIVPDHHLNYFDFDSLTGLIEKNSLRVKKELTNFPMELFLLMGQDYAGNPALGRQMHGWRKTMDTNIAEVSPELLRTFYEKLAEARMGRLAIVFAVLGDE
ncbi:class I SAM-dependent methyltransferase [Kordiimonas pumila]|uniref:Class I SAM-dependent methyltransferase n=1 Tax=Kordiimonas pumila TaxID=2161677 RepID=A0ABV7D285_9PROT|nr:class I SAM-dependent methyltransferase [Kordiimonas pumila]